MANTNTRARRRTQTAGWLRTNQSLRGEFLPRNDRVVDPLLWQWVKRIAMIGGAALLVWIAYGGFVVGDRFGSTNVKVIERIVERPVPVSTPMPTPVVRQLVTDQPPAPRWPSREDCEYHFKVVLHEAPAGRCQ